jgi:hypothetical protein
MGCLMTLPMAGCQALVPEEQETPAATQTDPKAELDNGLPAGCDWKVNAAGGRVPVCRDPAPPSPIR